jgi:molybdate transport system ATP-binding protein
MTLEVHIKKKLSHFELDVKLACRSGEIVALVGPSGGGKTTVIRILAGLMRPDQGIIRLHDRFFCDVKKKLWVPTRQRRLGYVFQEASLFPHLKVRGNVAFGCRDPQRVDMLLSLLGLEHLEDKKPGQISGGERQRVAFAQALAVNPQLLLLDEPFSALDIVTRQQLREKLIVVKKKFQIPMVLVTHDLEEASILGDKVITLDQGKSGTGWLTRLEKILPPDGFAGPDSAARCRTDNGRRPSLPGSKDCCKQSVVFTVS